MTGNVGNILTASQKNQLLAIQRAQRKMDQTQNGLASGKDVNSAIENPQNFFLSASLKNRASDLTRLLDGIGQSIRTVQVADEGLRAILRLLDQAEALLLEAEQVLYNESNAPEGNVLPDDINDFSSYSGAQDGAGAFNLTGGGTGISLDGNLWKRLDLDYEITENTVLQFNFQSENIPEIAAIGFDDDLDYTNNGNHFFIYGSQIGGITYAAPQDTFEYTGGGELQTIEIPVGEYFTGSFSGIHFINDNDAGGPGESLWQDIVLFEKDGINSDSLRQKQIAYENQYLDILGQIDALVNDAGYRGINLLQEDDLTTVFNEARTSLLTTEGIDSSAFGLGLGQRDFSTRTRLLQSIDQVRSARQTARQYNADLSNNLNVIKTRRNFTEQEINILNAGSDDLVVADQNKKGAELLALQVRQQIQFTVLSLFSSPVSALLQA